MKTHKPPLNEHPQLKLLIQQLAQERLLREQLDKTTQKEITSLKKQLIDQKDEYEKKEKKYKKKIHKYQKYIKKMKEQLNKENSEMVP